MSNVIYLSPTLPVNMSDAWFDIATLDHFWIKRRFEVFAHSWNRDKLPDRIAEIGCGHGLVLKQIKKTYGVQADGFDLNELALKQAGSDSNQLFYYNVHDRKASLKNAFDVIFLFDVIEHLEDDSSFLKSVLFHLKPGGYLIINVPAFQSLYSDYDRVVGHQRRYDIDMLRALSDRLGLVIQSWTYWGLMYLPLLWLRKQMMKGVPDTEVTKRGFGPQSSLTNQLLGLLGKIELLPNHLAGTSLLAILKFEL